MIQEYIVEYKEEKLWDVLQMYKLKYITIQVLRCISIAQVYENKYKWQYLQKQSTDHEYWTKWNKQKMKRPLFICYDTNANEKESILLHHSSWLNEVAICNILLTNFIFKIHSKRKNYSLAKFANRFSGQIWPIFSKLNFPPKLVWSREGMKLILLDKNEDKADEAVYYFRSDE